MKGVKSVKCSRTDGRFRKLSDTKLMFVGFWVVVLIGGHVIFKINVQEMAGVPFVDEVFSTKKLV